MDRSYEGKTAAEWIALLQSGNVIERCAAALALAEFLQNEGRARRTLVDALGDPDPPVQAAAQISLGLVADVDREHRRKMFQALHGRDEGRQGGALESLWNLLDPRSETPADPSEANLTADVPTSPTPEVAAPAAPLPVPDVPDLSVVHVMPWWFLLGGIVLCLGLTWFLRGIWWWKWAFAAAGAVAALYLCYATIRVQAQVMTRNQYRARSRIAATLLFTGLTCFLVGYFWPSGTVYIDNASGVDARLFLNGKEWVTIPSGNTKTVSLGSGRHRLSIHTMQNDHEMDAYDVEVLAYQKHVCNVLGGQRYFHGTVQYGVFRGGADMKIITAKWILVPDVDYLFRDMPERIFLKQPANKTFFTKASPPDFVGEQ